jgi:hypothetical protein
MLRSFIMTQIQDAAAFAAILAFTLMAWGWGAVIG